MRRTILSFALFFTVALAAPTEQTGGWISMGPSGQPHTEQKQPVPSPATTTRQFHQIASLPPSLQNLICLEANQCSFLEKFSSLDNNRWTFAHDYANGVEFDNWWSKDMVAFETRKRKVRLSVGVDSRHGKPYKSGQLQTTKWHGYGCYEVRMRPPAQEGLITTFFSYTGKYDAAPGMPKAHNEVDIEFVYKKKYKTMSLQANFFTNGRGGNEKIIPLKFNPSKKMHSYAFKWTSKGIEWYVDGSKVYTAKKNTPKIENGPHKIMMNLWPVSKHASGWGGNYVWTGERNAAYGGVRFTRGEDCKVRNAFARL